MSKYTVVRCDDWEALYVDGEVVSQNHSLDWPYELEKLGLDITTHWAQEFMDNQGGGWFPQKLEEVTWFDED